MVFESHGTLCSPEGGFSSGATVVVDCTVVVVASTGTRVVEMSASDVDEQATSIVGNNRSATRCFTHKNVSPSSVLKK
jgi:hypothetical protein